MALENVRKALLLKEELDQLRPLSGEQEARIMQKFRLDWNYHSNHLEGNSLTYGETKALILHGITAQGKPLKDHFEITGHDEAIKWIDEVIKEERPLTESFIRQLHTLLLKESYEKNAITPDGKPTKRMIAVGEYKTAPNHVHTKTGEIFYFATPEETPAKMTDLIDWFRKQKENPDLNPIWLAAEFHYKFIRIHPFDDGNGRTARILMNFILMQAGFPPVIIKTEDKENYYSVLRQADADILEPFVEYIATNLNRSLEIMIKGAKGESIDENNDIDKELFLLEQKLNTIGKKANYFKNKQVLELLFDNSIVPLFYKLYQSCSKFDKFYIENTVWVGASDVRELQSPSSIIKIKSQLEDKTKRILINYTHRGFNRDKMKDFNFYTIVIFEFEQKKYVIKNEDDEILLSRLYDENLTSADITFIVNHYAKKHLAFIKKIAEELNNKNE